MAFIVHIVIAFAYYMFLRLPINNGFNDLEFYGQRGGLIFLHFVMISVSKSWFRGNGSGFLLIKKPGDNCEKFLFATFSVLFAQTVIVYGSLFSNESIALSFSVDFISMIIFPFFVLVSYSTLSDDRFPEFLSTKEIHKNDINQYIFGSFRKKIDEILYLLVFVLGFCSFFSS